MKNVKLAIIYYSATGTNHQLASWAQEAANSHGAEVRLRKVKETAPENAIEQNKKWHQHLTETKDMPTAKLEDLEWADAIIFSTPTRYGNMPSQLAAFIDTTGGLWGAGKLANKVISAMTSAANSHGGQETTLLSIYKAMCHWGAIIAAPGYTDNIQFEAGGNPYGVSVSDGKENLTDTIKKAVAHQAERTLTVASAIKNGMS